MKSISKIALLVLVAASAIFTSCDKTKPYDVEYPAAEAHFTGESSQVYSILSATEPVYNVAVGTTDVTSTDRTITYNITSPTGAAVGTHYNIVTGGTTGTVTIPAGQATANIVIQGLYTPYNGTGRKDTLVITLASPSVKPSTFSNVVNLILRGPCFDGDVTLSDMNGTYAHSNDPDDALYTAQVNNLVTTSLATGTGTISNLWNGMGPVTINFDWTDPTNTTVSIPLQETGINYAVGQPILVRTSPGKINKFSVCNQEINLIVDIIVNNYPAPGSAAYYSQNYRMSIRR